MIKYPQEKHLSSWVAVIFVSTATVDHKGSKGHKEAIAVQEQKQGTVHKHS